MIQSISQSFIKDFRAYLKREECGLIIKAKYQDEIELEDPNDEDSKPGAKEVGMYFEFILSGALPRNGQPPKVEYMADGKTPTVKFRQAKKNAERVKEIFKAMGFKIIKAGWKIKKGRFSGTIDLVLECERDMVFDAVELKKGEHIVVDTKVSGLMKETTPGWNKHGWKWSPIQKEYHAVQAKQYHFLTGLKFFFLVIESANKEDSISDIRLFYVPIDEWHIEQHIAEGNDCFAKLEFAVKNHTFVPRPSLQRCQDCPLFATCESKHTFPHPELVTLDND